MIRPQPNTPAWAVLALVVEHPGELDAESIGQRLWRPRIRTPADVLAVRRAVNTDGEAWTNRASTTLGHLVASGLVERMRPPALADGIPVPRNADEADYRGWLLSLVEDCEPQIQPACITVLRRLVQQTPPPRTVAAWLGKDASGAAFRAAAALYDAGIVVAPTRRWPTPAGVALIERAS